MNSYTFFGRSASELASLLNISIQSARNKIKGTTEFTLSEVALICNAYQVTLKELELELLRIKESN